MGDAFKKVKPGDKLRMPAVVYNAVIDTVLDFQNSRQNQESTPQRQIASSSIVLVKNATGAAQDRFAVLGIDGPIYTPVDNVESFKNKLAFVGVLPTTAAYTGKFAILLEPAASGSIVRAVVNGVVAAKVNVGDATHAFADVNDSDSSSLKSNAAGSAQILWKETGTGVKWAVVRLCNVLAGTLTSPATLGSSAEGFETTSSDTWTRDGTTAGTNYAGVPLDLWVVGRVVYNHAGDKKLYAFLRKLSFDAVGYLRSVTGETRVEIDATEAC